MNKLLFRSSFVVSSTHSISLNRVSTRLYTHSTLNQYIKDPVKLLVIPLTKGKSYIYFKHIEEYKNTHSRLIKLENWANKKIAGSWQKIQASPRSYNKSIVKGVNFFLDKIHWQEHSLRSIPGEHYILKTIEDHATGKKEKISYSNFKKILKSKEIDKLKIKPLPVNVYFSNSYTNEDSLKKELNKRVKIGTKYHFKQMLYCILGSQLTLPLVLIPLLPNIPGFYLTYRAYCNFQAYMGAKHLRNLLTGDHLNLEYKNIEELKEVIDATNKDKPIVNKDVLENLQITEIQNHLELAIREEKAPAQE